MQAVFEKLHGMLNTTSTARLATFERDRRAASGKDAGLRAQRLLKKYDSAAKKCGEIKTRFIQPSNTSIMWIGASVIMNIHTSKQFVSIHFTDDLLHQHTLRRIRA